MACVLLRVADVRAATKAIVFALGAVVATPTWAYAQSATVDAAPSDTVVLRGGEILRGQVTRRGDAVAIRLTNGDVVSMPASEIERIERATPCALYDPPTLSVGATRPAVRVHINSPEPVDLEWLSHDGWQTLCTSPCDVRIPTKVRYRINGDGLRASEAVSLADRAGCVELDVRPSPSALHVPGIIATSVGGGFFGFGLAFSIIPYFAMPESGSGASSNPLRATATYLMISGAVTLTAGIAMLIASRRTAVSVVGLKSATTNASATPPARTAMWRGASSEERASPTPQLVPIFQASF